MYGPTASHSQGHFNSAAQSARDPMSDMLYWPGAQGSSMNGPAASGSQAQFNPAIHRPTDPMSDMLYRPDGSFTRTAGPALGGPTAGGPATRSGPDPAASPFGLNGGGMYDPYSFWPVARQHTGQGDPYARFRNMLQAGGLNPETIESFNQGGALAGGFNGSTGNPYANMRGGLGGLGGRSMAGMFR